MQLAFIIIFSIMLIVTILCIFLFREYKQDYIRNLSPPNLSIRFVLGFSALCTDLLYKLSFFKTSGSFNKTKKLTASVNVGESPDKSVYLHHLKLMSYTVVTILLSSFLGLAYTFSISDEIDNTATEIIRPSNGDGAQNISLQTDSSLYSGEINITVQDKKYTFEEVMEIYAAHRTEFDAHVLNNNLSFLHIDSPLNLPSVWGEENISISWFISSPDIIDYTGALIDKNVAASGVSVELVATMTLDDISADICYQLMVFPPKITGKDKIESYLSDFINSEQNLTQETITLPDNILGFNVSYFNNNMVYPSVDIYTRRMHSYYPCNFARETFLRKEYIIKK